MREIKLGDLVLSKNGKLSTNEYKKVTELHRNGVYEICIIKIRNSIIEANINKRLDLSYKSGIQLAAPINIVATSSNIEIVQVVWMRIILQ